jgi:hypothetical protein
MEKNLATAIEETRTRRFSLAAFLDHCLFIIDTLDEGCRLCRPEFLGRRNDVLVTRWKIETRPARYNFGMIL